MAPAAGGLKTAGRRKTGSSARTVDSMVGALCSMTCFAIPFASPRTVPAARPAPGTNSHQTSFSTLIRRKGRAAPVRRQLAGRATTTKLEPLAEPRALLPESSAPSPRTEFPRAREQFLGNGRSKAYDRAAEEGSEVDEGTLDLGHDATPIVRCGPDVIGALRRREMSQSTDKKERSLRRRAAGGTRLLCRNRRGV